MSHTTAISGPHKDFESIKKLDEHGIEYWEARELMVLLGYGRWENFAEVLKKAQKSCLESGQEVDNHFRDITKMVPIGSNTPPPPEEPPEKPELEPGGVELDETTPVKDSPIVDAKASGVKLAILPTYHNATSMVLSANM